MVHEKVFTRPNRFVAAGEPSVMLMNKQIALLRHEVESTLRMLHELKQFMIAMTNPEDVKCANRKADFWKLFEAAFQSKLLIWLRRIFDEGRDTFSIHKFLNNCKEKISTFSRRELKIRRSSHPNSHEWIDGFC